MRHRHEREGVLRGGAWPGRQMTRDEKRGRGAACRCDVSLRYSYLPAPVPSACSRQRGGEKSE